MLECAAHKGWRYIHQGLELSAVSNLDEKSCPLCGTQCSWDYQYTRAPGLPRMSCPRCGNYIARKSELEDMLSKTKQDAIRLSVLLYERRVTRPGLLPLYLHFGTGPLPSSLVDGEEDKQRWADPVRVTDLLRQWPEYGHGQLDRALLLLSKLAPVGHWIICERDAAGPAMWFAEDESQAVWIQKGLVELRWIDSSSRLPAQEVQVMPNGWAHIEELTRNRGARENDVFVAMWFGKPKKAGDRDREEERNGLYREAISPAIYAAGYRQHR